MVSFTLTNINSKSRSEINTFLAILSLRLKVEHEGLTPSEYKKRGK